MSSLEQHQAKRLKRNDEDLMAFIWGGKDKSAAENKPVCAEMLLGECVWQITCADGDRKSVQPSCILTADGKVKQWGHHSEWEKGQAKLSGTTTGPLIPAQDIVQIASGFFHYAAVAANGNLYTWGSGTHGMLGHGKTENLARPKRVDSLSSVEIMSVACGAYFTVALSKEGFVFTWGDRQCGTTDSEPTEGEIQLLPRIVEDLQDIVHISASNYHAASVARDGSLYTWGCGSQGRLGHGNTQSHDSPKLVESLVGTHISTASCGFFHTAVATTDGRVFTFGYNNEGQLGHNDRNDRTEPALVQSLIGGIFVSGVSCGCKHTIAQSSDGRVFTWGRGEEGQLGRGSFDRLMKPKHVECLKDHHVVRVAAFRHHTIVLAKCAGMGAIPVRAAWRSMVNDSEFSDITFLVEGEEICAHRAILARRCEYFGNMFRCGMRESAQHGPIPVPNVSKGVFLLLLTHLYSGGVTVDNGAQAIELYAVADMYQLGKLKETCCALLKHCLSVENSAQLLVQAAKSGYSELKDECTQFIVANFADVGHRGHAESCRR